VDNDQPVEDELTVLLRWQGGFRAQLSWEEVESAVGLRLPSDFKRLMSQFPSGAFAERYYVYSPVQSRVVLREFQQDRFDALSGLDEIREERDNGLPYPLYPEPDGLLPWGRGDEHIYFWKVDDVNNPDKWTVIFGERLGFDWGEYPGPMASFLLDVIDGRFSHPNLYHQVNEEELIFRPFEKYM
jgi:hypothetical protein